MTLEECKAQIDSLLQDRAELLKETKERVIERQKQRDINRAKLSDEEFKNKLMNGLMHGAGLDMTNESDITQAKVHAVDIERRYDRFEKTEDTSIGYKYGWVNPRNKSIEQLMIEHLLNGGKI